MTENEFLMLQYEIEAQANVLEKICGYLDGKVKEYEIDQIESVKREIDRKIEKLNGWLKDGE